MVASHKPGLNLLNRFNLQVNFMTYASVNLKALSALLQCKGFDLEGATFVDPAENRNPFREFSKGRCGVYVWQAAKGNTYVGRSTNLYTRIRSYFLPSVLKRKDQRVIFFFNKHGFKGVVLHILRLPSCTSIETLINLEQEVLDEIKPRLNVEPFARSTRYAQPFGHSEQSKHRRSKPVYVYDKHGALLLVFKSKQDTLKSMRIHHVSLTKCMQFNYVYLNYFVLGAHSGETPMYAHLDDFLTLVTTKRHQF